MTDRDKKKKKSKKAKKNPVIESIKEELHAIREPTYEEKLAREIEKMTPEKRERYKKRLKSAKKVGGHVRPPKGHEIEQYPGKPYSYRYGTGKPFKSDVEKIKSAHHKIRRIEDRAKEGIRGRVKEAAKKSDARKGRKREKRDKISPEFFAWMIWAIMLDILGLLLAGLTLITGGITAPLGFIPDIMGTATIGVQAWKDEGSIPVGKKSMKLLRKYGWEWIPIIGGAPLWTFFVFKDF